MPVCPHAHACHLKFSETLLVNYGHGRRSRRLLALFHKFSIHPASCVYSFWLLPSLWQVNHTTSLHDVRITTAVMAWGSSALHMCSGWQLRDCRFRTCGNGSSAARLWGESSPDCSYSPLTFLIFGRDLSTILHTDTSSPSSTVSKPDWQTQHAQPRPVFVGTLS